MTDDQFSDQNAQKALHHRLKALRLIGTTKLQENNATAQNILHEDLGMFGQHGLAQYKIDSETRDRLIAHTRQDASLAAINASTAMDLAADALRIAKRCKSLAFIILLVVFYIAVRVS